MNPTVLPSYRPKGTTCIIGFDSAWTDHPDKPGAICSLVFSNDRAACFKPPHLTSFDQALEFIEAERRACDICLVALDQPTIVPNDKGMRPVEKVAGALVGFTGGGVQPANRSKIGMFDDEAPIWRFLARLGAEQDPEFTRTAERGLFIIEVFPALALPAFDVRFHGCKKAPKYNPDNKNFQICDWRSVIDTVARYARDVSITEIEVWARAMETETIDGPCKADQDRLDAVLCSLIGYHWLAKPRQDSIMIGDLTSGYMIAPTDAGTGARLKAAAAKHDVPAAS